MNDDEIISLYEDTRLLVNRAVYSVGLQVKRLKASEPDLAQILADFHFLVTALTSIRQLAEGLKAIDDMKSTMIEAVQSFDAEVPQLRAIRNVLEHKADYMRGKGRNKSVCYGGMFTITLDPDQIIFADCHLRPDAALMASEAILEVIREKPPAAYARAVETHGRECTKCRDEV